MIKSLLTNANPANHIAVFQETTIRRTWHNEEWWFALSDVIVVLTESADPKQYIKKMRSRDAALDANWGTTCTPLALTAPDGKLRETNCANTEGLFRIIQSIPSPKAEPFKRWLAQVGYERVKEIENPELASARARELYQAKGYPQVWIEKRLRSTRGHHCGRCAQGARSKNWQTSRESIQLFSHRRGASKARRESFGACCTQGKAALALTDSTNKTVKPAPTRF